MANEIEVDLMKSGRHIFARIPQKHLVEFGRGDTVKISLLKKLEKREHADVLEAVNKFIDNDEKAVFKGSLAGYPVNLEIDDILKFISEDRHKSFLYQTIMKGEK